MAGIQLKVPTTKEEYEVYKRYFKSLDKDRTKVVTAETVKPFMEQSKLPGKTLGQIWALVDVEQKGFLNFKEFSALVRVISHILDVPSLPITPDLYQNPAYRIFEAKVKERKKTHRTKEKEEIPDLPLISNSDVARFSLLFDRTTGDDQLLPGDKARNIFMKANLPTPTLGDIWNICDREKDGSLNKAQFTMAMYLIGLCLSSSPAMNPVPKRVSTKLWQSAGLELSSPRSSFSRYSSLSSSSSSLSSRYTLSRPNSRTSSGSSAHMDSSALPRIQKSVSPVITRTVSGSSSIVSRSSQNESSDPFWEVTEEQANQYSEYFSSLDKENAKQLGPHVLVPYFIKSGLTRETLATVWDLADINKSGALNRDEFIMAMFLIHKIKTTRIALPSKIPKQLINSIRHTQRDDERFPSETSIIGEVVKPIQETQFASEAKPKTEHVAEDSFVAKTATGPDNKEKEIIPESLVESIREAKVNIDEHNDKIETATEKLKKEEKTRQEYETELNDLRSLEATLTGKLNTVNNAIKENNEKSAKFEQLIIDLKKENEKLSQQLTIAEGNYHATEAKVSDLEDEVNRSKKENEKIEHEIGQLQSLTGSLQPKLISKQEKIRNNINVLNGSTSKLKTEHITVDNLQKELKGLDDKLSSYKKKMREINSYEGQLKEISGSHENIQKEKTINATGPEVSDSTSSLENEVFSDTIEDA